MNFQPPSFLKPQEYPDIPKTIDDLFNAYAKQRQQDTSDLLQYGFKSGDATPEMMQQAQQPRATTLPPGLLPNQQPSNLSQQVQAPLNYQPQQQGLGQPEQVQEHPTLTAIRSYLAQKKAKEQGALIAQQANTAKDISQARLYGAEADMYGRPPSPPQTETIGGVNYLVHSNFKGEKQYSAIPERLPSQSENAARAYADKATQANQELGALQDSGFNPGATGNMVQAILPNALKNSDYQQLDRAKTQFINAILRRESGAAISAGEYTSYGKQYFPAPGDSPGVLKDKASARDLAIRNLASEGQRVPSQLKDEPARNSPKAANLESNQEALKIRSDFSAGKISREQARSMLGRLTSGPSR